MLKYLLDTHIAMYVIKRRPIQMTGVFNENAGRMALSSITLTSATHLHIEIHPTPTTSRR